MFPNKNWHDNLFTKISSNFPIKELLIHENVCNFLKIFVIKLVLTANPNNCTNVTVPEEYMFSYWVIFKFV